MNLSTPMRELASGNCLRSGAQTACPVDLLVQSAQKVLLGLQAQKDLPVPKVI